MHNTDGHFTERFWTTPLPLATPLGLRQVSDNAQSSPFSLQVKVTYEGHSTPHNSRVLSVLGENPEAETEEGAWPGDTASDVPGDAWPPQTWTYSSSVQGSVLFTRTWSSEPTWSSLPWMVILVPPALGPMAGSREWTRGSCGEEGRP